jgi:hypothetical protein
VPLADLTSRRVSDASSVLDTSAAYHNMLRPTFSRFLATIVDRK